MSVQDVILSQFDTLSMHEQLLLLNALSTKIDASSSSASHTAAASTPPPPVPPRASQAQAGHHRHGLMRSSAFKVLASIKVQNQAKQQQQQQQLSVLVPPPQEEDDEELLEMIASKLKHIVGNLRENTHHELAIDTQSIDTHTADWLQQTYSPSKRGSGSSGGHVFLSGGSVAASNLFKSNSKDATATGGGGGGVEVVAASPSPSSLSQEAIESLDQWGLDVLLYTDKELVCLCVYLFDTRLHLLEEFEVSPVVFESFVSTIASRYISSNTYHNFKHGVDVMHTVYRLLSVSTLTSAFTHLEVFSILVAALAHDVGHPGVNNTFLVNAKHAFALQHNDISPLESMHCAVLYEVLSSSSSNNIFATLSDPQWRQTRKIILCAILGTDMIHHAEQIDKAQHFLEANQADVHSFCKGEKDSIEALGDDKNRLYILELCLHSADVSNPYKPFELCSKWADLVAEEFAMQGDRESAEGLPISPMMNRATMNLCNLQMGFIEFAVAPLIATLVNIFFPLHEIVDTMVDNFAKWGERRKLEIVGQEEEIKKVDERVAKFQLKHSFTTQMTTFPKRST